MRMSPASPINCIAAMTCMETPVAPTGCPLDFSPPEVDRQATGFQGRAFAHHPVAFTGLRQSHRLIFNEFGNGEAIMSFDEGRSSSVAPASSSEPAQARRARPRASGSRRLSARMSLTCLRPLKPMARLSVAAVSSSARTMAAAPSEINEQSVRRRGQRHKGSSPIPYCRNRSRNPCAYGHRD